MVLPPGSDEQPDLVRRDLEYLDPRGVIRHLGTGLGDRLVDDVQNLHPALVSLPEGPAAEARRRRR